MKIAHEVYMAAIAGNWNVWREHYKVLTIDDLIWLNTAVSRFHGSQAHFNFDRINALFKIINIEIKHIKVGELGCYQGELAGRMLAAYPDIKAWIGLDINYHAISESVVKDKRYRGVKLTQWIYDAVCVPWNVFLSSHTFEHLNGDQIGRTFQWAHESGFEFMIIEMPFCKGDGWFNYHGPHVFEGTRDNFFKIAGDHGYGVFSVQTQTIFGLRRISKWKPKKQDTIT